MSGVKLNHKKFKSFKLKVHAIGITSENSDLIDLGDLHLSANGRNYQLTFGTENGCIQDNIIDMDIEIESLDVCKDTFEDCKFDLLESDLTDASLSATIHLSSSDAQGSSTYCLQAELIYDNKRISVKQDNAIYNDNIECLKLTFKENIEDESFDYGGVTITNPRTGHEFTLDVIQAYRTDNIIECELQCIAEMIVDDHYGIDCPMNLELSELNEDGLCCEFYLGGESDVKLEKAMLHIVNKESGISKAIVTCLEGIVEKHRLYKHLRDFLFEINEESNVAEIFVDIRREDTANFESKYKDMPLIHCDIASDERDTTAHIYMELSELLTLDESEAYRTIKQAA